MKINYDFYTGKDNYCDGDTEKDVIKYLEEYGEDNYKEIFKKDIRWPIFYHITPIRKNVLNWYPIKKDSEVLEIGAGMGAITSTLCDKAKYVTSVELSKQRASAIATRCKDKENLEIIVANFNDIKFEKKFDYITLIGVLEYASLYTNSKNPYHDFLLQIKSLLKDDGKLLIAIENQFGLKYFSGAWEDHTGRVFDGIIGYRNKQGIRTFGKYELENIFANAGFKYAQFYYPLPDYKLPNIIFSDEYMPDAKKIKEYSPYLSEERAFVWYDEKEAYLDIIKNDEFEFFANSFIIEASMKDFETEIDLSKQKLVQIDEITKKFYDTHYKLKDPNEHEATELEKNLLKENKKLQDELNSIVNSKSWKITKPIRDFRSRNK